MLMKLPYLFTKFYVGVKNSFRIVNSLIFIYHTKYMDSL